MRGVKIPAETRSTAAKLLVPLVYYIYRSVLYCKGFTIHWGQKMRDTLLANARRMEMLKMSQ